MSAERFGMKRQKEKHESNTPITEHIVSISINNKNTGWLEGQMSFCHMYQRWDNSDTGIGIGIGRRWGDIHMRHAHSEASLPKHIIFAGIGIGI